VSIETVLLHASAESLDPKAGPAAYAFGLAAAFGAHLTAFVFELEIYSPSGSYHGALAAEGRAAVERRNRDALAKAEALRRAAADAAISADVITARAHAHDVPALVAGRARLHDLSVMGVDPLGPLSERMVAEYVLFQSGRPMIAVPREAPGFAAERILVAWDFTPPAARAIADAMPFLERAAEVWIVTFANEKKIETALTADDLAAMLERHGIEATYETVPHTAPDISRSILDYAGQVEADMLVMGGYGHSRFREFVLGGATRGVLGAATLPVLMSH
jgi:nucleotide-binding universal stress UspA family protein